MSLAAGARLGPYEILGLIGAGGMGEVYRARDIRLDRTVAIKTLPGEISSDPDRRARFQREAKTIATLSHPYICTLYDVGEHASALFLVMEYLAGETLAARLSKGALPLQQAIDIGAEIAEALAAAHRAGIVHRDLKPANVMLTKSGVKLLDFGLAKLRGQVAFAGATATTLPARGEPLTGEGTILGTLHYMAPEQLEGKEADARTDIWALGLLLYEMLTGKRAFDGSSPASVISAIMSAAPAAPSATQRLAPPLLDRIVRRCLEKDPDRRWQSAGDCADELRFLGEPQAESPRARSRIGFSVAALLLLVAIAAAATFLLGRSTARRETRAISHLTVSLASAGVTLTEGGLAISPDGSTLVFAGRGRDEISRLYVRRLDEWEPRPLKGTDGAAAPFFSPDGSWVAFVAGGTLKKTQLVESTPQTLARVQYQGVSRGEWAADDRIFVTGWPGSSILTVPAEGGEAKPVGVRSSSVRYLWPQLLPDGKTLLFTSVAEARSRIAAVSLSTGSVNTVIDAASCARYVPSGHLVYSSEGHLRAIPFDPVRVEPTGSSRVVIDDIAVGEIWSTVAFAYDVSASGTIAYVSASTPKSVLVWRDRAGRSTPLNVEPRVYAFPSLSPDARRLSVTVYDWPATRVWVGSVDGEPLNQLTSTTSMCSLFSRDGRWIVFASRDESGWVNLHRIRADGSGQPERLLVAQAHQKPTSFWAGDKLLFNEANGAGDRDTVLTDTAHPGSRWPVLATSANEIEAAVSPDGKWMAYQSDESGRWEVYLRPLEGSGGRHRISIDGGLAPLWNPKGGELYYQTRDALVSVRITDGALRGTPTKLFPLRNQDYRRQYDVTPDGDHFLVMEPATSRTEINVITNWLEELKAKVPVTR